MTSHLTPREIQTRVRHGASPEDLAQQTGMDLNKIMAFALPVLAERQHIVDRARQSVVRRRYVDGHISLDAALIEHVDPLALDTANWDAKRSEGHKWVVTLVLDDSAVYEFIYDAEGRYVIASSFESSTLIGDTLDDTASHMALADAVSVYGDTSVAEPRGDSEEFLTPPEPEVHADGVISLKAVRDQRALDQLPLAELGFEDIGADPAETHDAADTQSQDPPQEPEPPTRVKKNHRRRVPSWDEIMFGDRES